nr:MAG TPA: hypothetical protein [Caudoviricetes sp.]
MGCYSCGGNPNTFCRDCTYPKDTWIAPVDSLPDTFMGDFDHLFRTPDGNMYALAPDRSSWILMGGAGGTVQKPQNIELNNNTRELTITRGNTVTLPNDTQSLAINGRTITISNGNAINLPEDRDTVYDDAELRRRIQAVEDKADNFVSGVTVSREGNKVKLTYTFVNGAPKEVEFEDKDTISLVYDDTALKARVKALEDKPDKDTVYDDRGIKRRLDDLEARPYPNKDLFDRLETLEAKQDRDNQSLALDTNTRVLSISNGNNVTLPNDKQTITKEGNKLILSNGGGEVELPQPNNTQAYDDTALRNRVKTLEDKADRDNQTLTFNRDNRTLSLSGGNSVTLPNDKQTISKSGNKIVLSNGGGEVDIPTATPYDDTDIKRRLGVLESKEDKDTKYKAKGNGLFLDSDNTFHIEMALNKDLSFPYLSSTRHIPITSDKRYDSAIKDSISYAVNNDGTEQRNLLMEAGILFDYEGNFNYTGVGASNISGSNFRITGLSTNNTIVDFDRYTTLSNSIRFDSNVYASWKDSNNKAMISLKPKIIWSVVLSSHTEYYTHYITKEELDSSEPIEIEVKKNDVVIGKLNLTLKNVRFYIQSVQGTVVLKNQSDNKYYNIPRLN